MSDMSDLFDFSPGSLPLLISIPHLGTAVPDGLERGMADVAAIRQDTDWHLDRLHAFAADLGASVLAARVSRYVIDLNRPPGGESLYPGQTTTGLCPTETFRGEPLYRPGAEPDAAEIARRLDAYWRPYHEQLRAEIGRLRSRHGAVLLWEAHSIASVLPRLFDGKLPDLNFGTADGRSCAPSIIDAVLRQAGAGPYDFVHNGRFKGGYITRHHGAPGAGVHAIQLEMCQSLYMDEAEPFDYDPGKAARLQPLLRAMLAAGVEQLRHDVSHRAPG